MKDNKRTIRLDQVGVAILSTDRVECTKKLLDSIESKTPTIGWRVFVMDDSSEANANQVFHVCQRDWVDYRRTGDRIGVARNTNEAMKVLEEFEFKIILNNDVEILKRGWALIYPMVMVATGYHHLCFQQEGLWGAGTEKRPQTITQVKQFEIKTIHNFPQGAVMAYDQKAFKTVGYFDAKAFQGYGKSHWDWSFRVSDSGIQPEGIHDVIGSNNYFVVHNELCCTPMDKRVADYKRNSEIFELMRNHKGKRIYIPYG